MDMNELTTPYMYQLGRDSGLGNLLGIEPYITPQNYASKESFFDMLNSYMLAARREKWLNQKTIVLFPEYIGTWLVLANEKRNIFGVSSLARAERVMFFSHLWKAGAYLLKSKEKDRAAGAFFRMKAEQMAEIYQDVFSRLAREYAVTIVAGSIVLPAPQISSQGLILNEGPLHNISIVFQPDGTPVPRVIHKAFPTSKELVFTTPGSPADLPAFETPAGRLGVLICADSWFAQAYVPLREQKIDLLVVPSYDVFGVQSWNQPWLGYDGWRPPADVDVADVGKITEAQAWEKYSLAGRIDSSGAKYGMNIFMRGKLWDQDLGGRPATLVRDTHVYVEEQTQRASILNVWI
jgi:predicted amidohydrolase